MGHVPPLVERYFQNVDGELYAGGVACSVLANQYGTPLFVYDRHVLDQNGISYGRVCPQSSLSAIQ